MRKTIWKNGKENIDFIYCEICKNKLRQIHKRHLISHNITFEEYKQRFPNTPTVTETYSKLTAIGNSNREVTAETCEKIRIANTGKLVGDKNPSCRKEVKEKKSKALLDFYKTEEGKLNKLQKRKQALKRIGLSGTSVSYNNLACKYFDWLNMYNGWGGKHALNGGEKEVLGYFVDYYEPELNIVIEWDEPGHYFDSKLKDRDIFRMNEIIDYLKCDFYRINQTNMNIERYN